MRLKLQYIIFLFFISVILFNCTVSKRHYRKGYHIAWHNNSSPASKEIGSSKVFLRQERINRIENQLNGAMETTQTEITASAKKMKVNAFKRKQLKQLRLENDSCADLIIFRDGTELTAKIVEVFNGTVKYLPCNNLDGPLRVANGEKIFMIKYANGTKEVFKESVKTETQAYQTQKQQMKKKKNGLAVASFILSLFWFIYFIPAIIALILGIIALNQMKANPDMYDNKWMAKFGITVACVLGLLLTIATIGA